MRRYQSLILALARRPMSMQLLCYALDCTREQLHHAIHHARAKGYHIQHTKGQYQLCTQSAKTQNSETASSSEQKCMEPVTL